MSFAPPAESTDSAGVLAGLRGARHDAGRRNVRIVGLIVQTDANR